MEHGAAEVLVTEAAYDDVGAFASFFWTAWRQAGPDAPGFAGASDEVIAELTTTEAIQQRIGGPERRMFLAWEDQRVVGFAATKRIDADTVELAGIIVLEDASGMGVGTQLVEGAVLAAGNEGYRTMIVRTEIGNLRAQTFYEGLMFTLVGRGVEHVEGSGVEVWELTRTISD